MKQPTGTLALLGGGEWHEECRTLDEELLAAARGNDVVVLPTAAAFEQPEIFVDEVRTAARAIQR